MASGAVDRFKDRFDDKARGSFEPAGHTTVYRGELLRHSAYTRVLHWMVALFFFLSLFTGFAVYLPWLFRWFTPFFGGGPLSREMHPWFGLGFVVCFVLQALNWLQPMIWTPADSNWMRDINKIVSGQAKMEPPDTGFFNAGQKVQFWEIVGGCIAYLITGIILWAGARTFGRTSVAISYVIHDISALIMLGGIFIHIYQSTFGEPGTFQAMVRGAVSEAWAWTFHPAWYQQVTGRDPEKACEEARRQMYGASQPEPRTSPHESVAPDKARTGAVPKEVHGQRYISLATFRKSGVAVYTPIWFVEQNNKLYFMTSSKLGKCKRIRNNPQVKIAPCTVRGKITGPEFPATARILPPEEFARVRQAINAKYWLARVPFLWRSTDTCLEITPT